MIAAGCCLGLVKLLLSINGCRLLTGSRSGAGGTDGVHVYQGNGGGWKGLGTGLFSGGDIGWKKGWGRGVGHNNQPFGSHWLQV